MERKLKVASGASPGGVATMWAVVQRSHGPPSAPESSGMAIPVPGTGDVLVQVSAASVHPGDCFIVTGQPYVARLAHGLRRPRHAVPGMDLPGVVAAVGKDVTNLRPGDEVFGWSTAGALRLRPSGQPCAGARQSVGRARGSSAPSAGSSRRALSGFTRQQMKPVTSIGERQDLLTLADLLTIGQATPVIDRTYPSTTQPMPSATSRPARPREGRRHHVTTGPTRTSQPVRMQAQTYRLSGGCGRTPPERRKNR